MWKLLIIVAVVLYIIYYLFMMAQFLFGIIEFTHRKLTFGRALLPFYFWIASNYEHPNK